MAMDLAMLETAPQLEEMTPEMEMPPEPPRMTVEQAIALVQPAPVGIPTPAPARFTPDRLEGPVPTVSRPMMRRYITYPLPSPYGDELGWLITYWVNMPRSVAQDLTGAEFLRVACQHNGWRDEAGEVYPPCTAEEFWVRIPGEVHRLINDLGMQAFAELPNSVVVRKGS